MKMAFIKGTRTAAPWVLENLLHRGAAAQGVCPHFIKSVTGPQSNCCKVNEQPPHHYRRRAKQRCHHRGFMKAEPPCGR